MTPYSENYFQGKYGSLTNGQCHRKYHDGTRNSRKKNNFSCHFTLNNQEQSSVFQIPLLELIPNQQRKAVIKVWKRREKSRTYFSRKLTLM
jgi:hypothetical protein